MLSNINTATGWMNLWNAPGAKTEYRVYIGGYYYEGTKILSLKQYDSLFTGAPSVGNVMAGEMDLEVILPSNVTIPRMGKIEPKVRRVVPEGTSTAWYKVGTYYVDTREQANKNGAISLHAYDAVLMMEQPYISSYPTTQKDYVIISDILQQIGSQYIDTTVETLPWSTSEAYNVPFTAGTYTIREMLSYIAASHMCNVVINGFSNKLRFVPITGITGTYAGHVDLGESCQSLEVSPTHTYSGVEVIIDSDQSYKAGTETGEVFDANCPWATQEMATACYAAIQNWTYQPFKAEKAYIPPMINLGDEISIIDDNGNTITSIINTWSSVSPATYCADIGADYPMDIDHEYTFETKATRAWKKEAASIRTSFAVETQAITARVEANEENIAAAELAISGLTVEVSKTQAAAANGIENLLPYPYSTSGETRYGLTYTDMGDGSLKMNGTSTYYWYYDIETSLRLAEGTYTIQGAVANNNYIYVREGSTDIATDWGNGATFTLTEPKTVKISLLNVANKTYTDYMVYPMLTKTDEVQENWRSPVNTASSQIQITADGLSSKVSSSDYNGNTIATLINQTTTTIQLQASKIDLQGYVTATSLSTAGQTTINGGNITTGNIKVGGSDGNQNGVIAAYDSSDNLVVKIDKSGLWLGSNQRISCSNLYGGTIKLGGTATDSYGKMEVYDSSNNKIVEAGHGGLFFYNASNQEIGEIHAGSSGQNGKFTLSDSSLVLETGSSKCSYSNNQLVFSYGTTERLQMGYGTGTVNGIVYGLLSGKRVKIDDTGIYFYNAAGVLTKSYPAT